QPGRDPELPGDRLSAGVLAVEHVGTARQPVHDPGADPVLDLDPGTGRGLDRIAAIGRPGQQGADRAGPDPGPAGIAVQPDRRVYLDDPHPAAVHDPAAIQRDEIDSADLYAGRDFTRQPSVRRVLARVRAADLSGRRRRRPVGVHPR